MYLFYLFISQIGVIEASIYTEMTVNSSLDASPLVNETANITVTVYSIIDALNTTVNITLPAGFELASGNLSWNTSISSNETKEFKIEIKAIQTGKWKIEVTAINENPRFGDIDFLFVNITDNSSSRSKSPPIFEYIKDAIGINISNQTKLDFNQTPNITSIYNKSYVRSIESFSLKKDYNSSSSKGDARVIGYFYYNDTNSEATPARYILTRIYDWDDSTGDELLAEVLTDVNGYFDSGWFNNNDYDEEGTQDIYVVWYTVSSAAAVADPEGYVYATWTGGYWANIPDGTFDILNWISPSDEKEPWWIYDTILDGWNWLTNNPSGPDWTMEQSVVIYPSSDTEYDPGGYIYLEQEYASVKDVIIHEYGHNTMYVAYGNYLPENDCGGSHSVHLVSASNCAWFEGWANFQSLVTYNDPVYSMLFRTYNLETRNGNWIFDSGDLVEGNVAASLWDIYDSNDDGYDEFE